MEKMKDIIEKGQLGLMAIGALAIVYALVKKN